MKELTHNLPFTTPTFELPRGQEPGWYHQRVLMGTPNREPKEYSGNIMEYKDPGRYIRILFLLCSWGPLLRVPSKFQLYQGHNLSNPQIINRSSRAPGTFGQARQNLKKSLGTSPFNHRSINFKTYIYTYIQYIRVTYE